MSDRDFDLLYKIALVGDPGVGKSSLFSRFTREEFNFDYRATIGVDLGSRTLTIDGKVIGAQIWDAAGQERYQVVNPNFAYRGGFHGVLLVYDITERATYTNVARWLNDLMTRTGNGLTYHPNNVAILVGNKSDLGHLRAVPTDEAKAFAAQNDLLFVETSARDASNVESLFQTILADIYQSIRRAKGP